jgi:Secretion system C-terminal sorting domain/Carboxylesterase family
MKRLASFIITLLFVGYATAQLPYTSPVYPVRKDSAVKYGIAPNYCGRPDTLKMNIYKPVGDNNRLRPVIIFVHGGGFTSTETFNEYHMNALAIEFAKRGYVAASIDYREGHHLFNYGIGTPVPIGLGVLADWTEAARLYVSDSAEVVRSVYRAQQDTKAAIRFMKQNHIADSTSTCRVFLGGHSAGGITVTAASFTDLPAEKSPLSGTTTTVANPNWISGGFDWFGTWVITQINGPQDRDDAGYRAHNPAPFNYDAASCYTRPDLGIIDGDQNTIGGYNSNILGVASLAGAVIDTNIFNGPNHPAIYMYHIPNDIVVPYNYGYPFTFWQDLLSPAPHGRWPLFYGSSWMKGKLDRMNYGGPYKFQSFDNGGNITNSHDILPNDAVVADSIARFFAKVIDTSSICFTVLAGGFDFSLSLQNKVPVLQWAADCGGTRKYIIERSLNGQQFMAVDSVQCGSAQFTDRFAPAAEKFYYRIKLIKTTGSYEYSKTRYVVLSRKAGFSIYPNPAPGYFTLELPTERVNEELVLRILDVTGREVYSKDFTAQQQQSFYTGRTGNGSYRVVITGGIGQVLTGTVMIVQ